MKTKLMRVNMAEGGGKFVRLNVGGRFFQTTVDTLTNQESMFSAMMSGRMDLVADEEGAFCFFFFCRISLFLMK